MDYSRLQLSFYEFDSIESETQFDLFPLMPFAYGKTKRDQSILCSRLGNERIAVTADHPFTVWLLRNAEKMCRYYPIHFNRITRALCSEDSHEIISAVDLMKEQLAKTSLRYDININDCPKLSENDFLE